MRFLDKTFVKFVLVGIINTVFGSAIMFCMYNLFNAGYWLSSAANYTAGGILSFFLNKYFTFNVKRWNIFMIIAFCVNIMLSYVIAYGFAKSILNHILQNFSQNIRENTALFAGMCLFTGINYLGQRFIVFKIREEKYVEHN